MTTIFKICDSDEWAAAKAAGVYEGSDDDRRDGFIHFCTAPQLARTLAKHYAGRDNLVLIAIDADYLGDALKWELAGSGELYPHLYSSLTTFAAEWTKPLPLGADGVHILPLEAQP